MRRLCGHEELFSGPQRDVALAGPPYEEALWSQEEGGGEEEEEEGEVPEVKSRDPNQTWGGITSIPGVGLRIASRVLLGLRRGLFCAVPLAVFQMS